MKTPSKPKKAAPPKRAPVKATKSAKVAKAKTPAPKVAKPTTAKASAAKPAVAKKFAPRADLGAPIDGFFVKQPPHLRPILEALRALVDEAAPDATASIKWGMPFYSVGPTMMCALAGFKAHVNLILAGPPGSYADPDGLLEGDAKNGRHLKLRTLDALPTKTVRGWLRTAADVARKTGA